jgi:two-component system response regulator RegA
MTELRRRVLLVDDDAVFAAVLSRALAARGFDVVVAADSEAALGAIRSHGPDHAVVDLKLGAESGLALIPRLLAVSPRLNILLLTGYASIATAVEAMRRGAKNYLAKPVDADAVARALLDDSADDAPEETPAEQTPHLKRLEWEHIQRVLAECDGNISEAARRLGLHRRTLQRKLTKRPVREPPQD